MKKRSLLAVLLCLLFVLGGCGHTNDVKDTVTGSMKTYYEMADGTWLCDNLPYEYRLEIKGRLNSAACDSVYVYLSNKPEITFEEAWKASGLSSNTDDYFPIEEAVLVEIRTE